MRLRRADCSGPGRLRRLKEIDLEDERTRMRVEKAVLKFLSEKRFRGTGGG
jgi:hypothetical protein